MKGSNFCIKKRQGNCLAPSAQAFTHHTPIGTPKPSCSPNSARRVLLDPTVFSFTHIGHADHTHLCSTFRSFWPKLHYFLYGCSLAARYTTPAPIQTGISKLTRM